MRKIIWVVVALALALALAGCDTDKVGEIPDQKPNGQVSIRINDNIQRKPSVVLRMNTVYTFQDQFSAEAQVRNLPNPDVYKWYLDNTLVEGADSSVYTETLPAKGEIAEGYHTITCVASSGDIVCSAIEWFSVLEKTFEGTWWVESKPDESRKVYLNLGMHGGHMVYDYYNGYSKQASLGQESEYQIQKSGEDYEISFYNRWNGGRCRFVVRGGDLGNVKFNDPRWGIMTDVTFEPFVSGPEWTDGYAEYDDEWHVRTISNPEFGTFEVSGTTEVHQFDENGICKKCGYDSTKHLYEVNSDFSVVDESVDFLDICRYWPGLLTLYDGTVVDDANSFYIEKWFSSSYQGNRYTLYIPYTIVDFYVRNGGGVEYMNSTVSAFRWYLKQTMDYEFQFDYGGGCGPYNEVLQELFANGNQIESLDPGTIQKPDKVKVSNDVSKLESLECDRVSWFDTYTLNDMEFEDGSPVAEADAFYFSVLNNNRIKLFLPDCIQREYEKGQGVNPETCNHFWWYLRTYHPEIKVYQLSIDIEALKQLVSSEFIQPSYLDIGSYKD